MRTSQTGIDLIKKWEGYRGQAYYCPTGHLTVGYGHTNKAGTYPISEATYFSKSKAEKILKKDLVGFERCLSLYVKKPLSQNQYDAFISILFNIGPGEFASSTFLRRFNAGESPARVAEAMSWWNKGTVDGKKVVIKGLVFRRREEAKIFQTPSGTTAGGGRGAKTPVSILNLILSFFKAKGQ